MAEEKEVFQLRLELKSGNTEVDDYLEQLHTYLINWEASSIKQMLLALDETALEITKDLRMINAGEAFSPAYVINSPDGGSITFPEVCKLKVLNDNKESKVYDRVMTLVGKVKDFKTVCDMADAIRPEIKKEDELKKKAIRLDPSGNPFEQLQKQRLEEKSK